ncbi:hypothetical protein V6Z11_D09G212700 [Gossypium hirsutum]|uniref:Uncharacterized protein n=1 Tax=Gossypium tomentosum TaxID=34277 RepID=A0A5D2JJW3_GOSTO|nr:hypothetical protein ES332_D09G218700v1 [Gossypium tomentosum]
MCRSSTSALHHFRPTSLRQPRNERVFQRRRDGAWRTCVAFVRRYHACEQGRGGNGQLLRH